MSRVQNTGIAMSKFWIIIWSVAMATLFVYFQLPMNVRGVPFPIWAKVVSYSVAATMVGIAWAICFRPQLEKGRVSLLSVFVLVSMQAILAWFIQQVGTFAD